MSETGPKSHPSGASGSWSEWAAEHADESPVGVGSVVRERFVLEEIIGSGGMGVVFRARDLRRDEAQDRHPHVAIKFLAPEFKRHPDALRALQREARKAQRLAHPNIGSVYDFDRDGANVYLVMELLEGEPLSEQVKAHAGRGLERTQALHVIEEAALALAHAHSKGVVHSDFKPSNVFMTRGGEAKVIDFGIARAARSGAAGGDVTQTVFDAAKLGAATLAYASPEQLLGVGDPDPRDDIYSLAVVAYELLAGRHPFNRRSALEAQLAEMRVEPVAGLGEASNAVLRNALSFKRELRPPSVNDFVVGLGLAPVVRSLAGAPPGLDAASARTLLAQPLPMATGATLLGLRLGGNATGRRVWNLRWLVAGVAALALAGGAYAVYSVLQQREQQQQAERERVEAERRAAEAQAERERVARQQAEAERRAAEERVVAEREARAQAERDRLLAEAQAERERTARERAEKERLLAARRAEKAEPERQKGDRAASGSPQGSGRESSRPAAKADTLYRWQDDKGEVHYGKDVPAEYAGRAVPLVSPE